MTFRDAGVGFVAGMTAAIVVAVLFVMFRSIEQTFLPVAMLLRSVPLVAMAPVIVLIFGRDLVGVAVIGGIACSSRRWSTSCSGSVPRRASRAISCWRTAGVRGP